MAAVGLEDLPFSRLALGVEEGVGVASLGLSSILVPFLSWMPTKPCRWEKVHGPEKVALSSAAGTTSQRASTVSASDGDATATAAATAAKLSRDEAKI